jgi:hypothetical protein
MTEQEKINEVAKELFTMTSLSEMLSQDAKFFETLGVKHQIKQGINAMTKGHDQGIRLLRSAMPKSGGVFMEEMTNSEEKIRSLNVIFKILIMQNEELLSNYEDALVNLVKNKNQQDETNAI